MTTASASFSSAIRIPNRVRAGAAVSSFLRCNEAGDQTRHEKPASRRRRVLMLATSKLDQGRFTREAMYDLRRRRAQKRELGSRDIVFWKVTYLVEEPRSCCIIEILARQGLLISQKSSENPEPRNSSEASYYLPACEDRTDASTMLIKIVFLGLLTRLGPHLRRRGKSCPYSPEKLAWLQRVSRHQP